MDAEALRRLALIGARARLVELDQERAQLLAAFPELSNQTPRKPRKPRVASAKASEPRVLFDAAEGKGRRERLIELIEAGKTAVQIGHALNMEPRNVRKSAKRLGLKIAPASPRPRRVFSDEERAAVVKRIRAGEFLPDLVRELDIRDSVLRRWAADAGVAIRKMSAGERRKRTLAVNDPASHAAQAKHGKKGPRVRAYRPQHDDERRAELMRRIEAGERPYVAARTLGVSKSTAYKWLNEGRKGPRNPNRNVMRAEQRPVAVQRVRNGETVRDVAKDMGIPRPTVEGWIRKDNSKHGED